VIPKTILAALAAALILSACTGKPKCEAQTGDGICVDVSNISNAG